LLDFQALISSTGNLNPHLLQRDFMIDSSRQPEVVVHLQACLNQDLQVGPGAIANLISFRTGRSRSAKNTSAAAAGRLEFLFPLL
jgi:hypothetical protein